jgi:molecular chaperone DnaK
VKTAFEKLSQSQQKLGEAIYAQGQAEQAAGAGAQAGTDAPADDSSDEDVVDAEVVDDEDEKK